MDLRGLTDEQLANLHETLMRCKSAATFDLLRQVDEEREDRDFIDELKEALFPHGELCEQMDT